MGPLESGHRGHHHADRLVYCVRLRPHRSLDRGGRRLTLASLALLQGGCALLFLALGAWPVALTLLAVWLGLVAAFRSNARAALAHEDIALSALELRYARVDPEGGRRDWRFHPLWVRLDVERHEEFGVERLSLRVRRASIEVGAFLGRRERTRLADELAAGLASARRGPRFD